jgi:methylglutaconyl-CoA hydratase
MGCELRAGIAHVPLNVGVGGALTSDTVRGVTRTIERLGAEHECRAIVLNSQGGLFGAGFDLAEAGDAAARGDDTPAQDFAACLLAISRARQPVIAAVDGKATAGAMGLVAASDIVIASLRATFQLPEMAFGMLPAIITPYLRRRMPPARLRYLVLSSRTVDVREAHQFGLVDEIAETSLDDAVDRQVRRIARSSPEALAEYKRQFACNDDEAEETVVRQSEWMRRPGMDRMIADLANGLAPEWFSGPGKVRGGSGDN